MTGIVTLFVMLMALGESLLMPPSKCRSRTQFPLKVWDVNLDDDDTRIVIDSILEQTLNNLYGRSVQGLRGPPKRELINCSLPELHAYHKLYGNVLVPPHFVFPADGSCSVALAGFPLGQRVSTLRQQYWQTTLYTMTEFDKEKLQKLGFEFKASKAHYALRYHELSMFKRLHGNLLVDRNFIVPAGDESPWPYPHHGCRLGQVVKNIRNKRTFSDKREQLEALGLVYDGKVALLLRAIELWHSLHGDGNLNNINSVPVRWSVPRPPDRDSEAWPSELHGMRLGEALRRIRKKGAYSAHSAVLREMGLVIDQPSDAQ